jgi:hypothetical protein
VSTRHFYTPAMQAWLGGYEPVLAAQIAADHLARATAKSAAANTKQRMEGTKKGWGSGTVHGLSSKPDPAKAGRIKKASKL